MIIPDESIRPDQKVFPFPLSVTIAGIVWIVYGSVVLLAWPVLAFGALIVLAFGTSAGGIIAITVVLIWAAVGIAFVTAGTKSVKGTGRDTLGKAIWSIIVGIGLLAARVFNVASSLAEGQIHEIRAAISIFFFLGGVSLFAAGFLALLGREPYQMWRKAAFHAVPSKIGDNP